MPACNARGELGALVVWDSAVGETDGETEGVVSVDPERVDGATLESVSFGLQERCRR